MEDKKIVELFLMRSEEAIVRLSEKYGRMCTAIARRITGGDEDAREAVNSAYLAIWNAIPPRRPENLGAFTAKITRNESLKLWERGHAQKRGGGETALALEELSECVATRGDPAGQVEAGELAGAVDRFLTGLGGSERGIFLRRYWYLEPIALICRDTGYSASRVKSQLSRTRAKLRRFLIKEELLDE